MSTLVIGDQTYRVCVPCTQLAGTNTVVLADSLNWNGHLDECHAGTSYAQTARVMPVQDKIARSVRR